MSGVRLTTMGIVLAGLTLATLVSAEPATKRPTDVQRGRELYDRHCFQCHGFTNRGDGPATTALVHEVPDLVGRIKVDDSTVILVERGRGAMPGFEASFDRADARRVLTHMAKLGTGAEPPPAEEAPPADEDAAAAEVAAEAAADFDGGDVAPE